MATFVRLFFVIRFVLAVEKVAGQNGDAPFLLGIVKDIVNKLLTDVGVDDAQNTAEAMAELERRDMLVNMLKDKNIPDLHKDKVQRLRSLANLVDEVRDIAFTNENELLDYLCMILKRIKEFLDNIFDEGADLHALQYRTNTPT